MAEVEREVLRFTVEKLQENTEYMFRVIAENPVGASEPLESDRVTLKSPTGAGE